MLNLFIVGKNRFSCGITTTELLPSKLLCGTFEAVIVPHPCGLKTNFLYSGKCNITFHPMRWKGADTFLYALIAHLVLPNGDSYKFGILPDYCKIITMCKIPLNQNYDNNQPSINGVLWNAELDAYFNGYEPFDENSDFETENNYLSESDENWFEDLNEELEEVE